MASSSEIGSGKTILILSLVIGCFAVLWPKIFYPMLQASISSSVEAPYSEVSGVYHSNVLPCCHPVTFTKELNALYFTELCERLQWRAGQPPDHRPSERRHELWTPGLARWCRDELQRTCGVQLDEPALERFRRAGADSDTATRNLTRCLELSYDLRREGIRITRTHLKPGGKYSGQERPNVAGAAVPHAAAAAAHVQAQNLRQPRRTGDRGPRPVPGMRPTMGAGYSGFIQPQPKGSGAMGIIMPIYTIGIVVFFMYTIMRVMFKKNDKTPPMMSEVPATPATVGRYRVQPDTADGRGRVQTVPPPIRREHSAKARHAASLAAAAPTPPQNRRAERAARQCLAAEKQEAPPAAAIPLPAKPEEAEIDHLRRRLEDTERAMERIMQQMNSVSHKLNAAKISSNIRALKEELWGSVESLASESCATDYSLDSRAQVLTDASLWTYSLDSAGGYTRSYGAPSAYSLETSAAGPLATSAHTAPLASAVSKLYRSVSQLSLELETAPAGEDEVSLPAETGAELSELHEGEDEVVDGVDELRYDGENAVRRFASLEALQQSRASSGVEMTPANTQQEVTPQSAGRGQAGEAVETRSAEVDSVEENGVVAAADVEEKQPTAGAPAELENTPVRPIPLASDGITAMADTPALSGPRGPSPISPVISELRSATCPHSFPSGISCPGGSEQALSTPRVIVLGLRTKRTPEREPPRSLSFRLGGDPGQVLASCHADGLLPESAVMIRETETRAPRRHRTADTTTGLETKLELEIAGMEATSPPPRSAWAARLHAATETSLAAIEDDLKKAAQALKNVSRKVPGTSGGKDTKKVSAPPDTTMTGAGGVQEVRDAS